MKHLAALLLLTLPACTTMPSAPVQVSDATTLDEQTALAVELAYQAAAQTMLLTGAARSPAVKVADNRAYVAVKAVRAAYAAGNAKGYASAAVQARTAVKSLLTAIKG